MARPRLELHEILCDVLGSRNVYFQPPESIKMEYPAIVYSLDDLLVKHADDDNYLLDKRYSVMLIDSDPDNDFILALESLPMCSLDRVYCADNLNHYVYTLYY